jgi:hypothetical protein
MEVPRHWREKERRLNPNKNGYKSERPIQPINIVNSTPKTIFEATEIPISSPMEASMSSK